MPPIFARTTPILFVSFSVSFAAASDKPAPLPILKPAPMIYDAWHMPTQRALMVCAAETDSARLVDSLSRQDRYLIGDCSNRSDSLYPTTGIQYLPQDRWIGVARLAPIDDADSLDELKDCVRKLECKYSYAGPYCASRNPDRIARWLGDPLDNRLNAVLDGPHRYWLGIRTGFVPHPERSGHHWRIETKVFDTLNKTWSKPLELRNGEMIMSKSMRIYDLGRGVWVLHLPFFDLRKGEGKIRWVGDPLRLNMAFFFDGKSGRLASDRLLLPKGDIDLRFYDRDGDGFHEVGIFLEPGQTAEMTSSSVFDFRWQDSLFVPSRSYRP